MKIIITPQVQNVYNQNVNNIYIQNPQYDLNFDKNKNMNSNNNLRNYNSNDNSRGMNNSLHNRPNSVNKKDYNMSLNRLNNPEGNKQQIRNDYNSAYNDKINRGMDNQKYMHNNYLSNQNVLE